MAKDKGKGKAVASAHNAIEDMDITSILSNAGLDAVPLEDDLAQEEQELDLEDDDDNDSLNEWIQEDQNSDNDSIDEELMNDDEIIKLLDKRTENRAKLKTGDAEEMQREIEEFDNNLALTTGIGAGRVKGQTKKRLLKGEIRLSDEEKRKLGQANALYINRNYGEAIDILQEIIQKNPKVHPAWNTLGLVHEELGNKELSLKLRMMGAHICNDASLWKELGQKSIENEAITQAIQCFTKVISLDPTDVDALWDRSFLYKQHGRIELAVEGFTKILEYLPHHFKVINELAQLFRKQGRTKEAIKLYEDAILYHTEHYVDQVNDEEEDEEEFVDKLGYAEINMLSELYLILNDYYHSLDTIKTGLRLVQKRQNETWWQSHTDDDDEYLEEDEARTDFPLELRVRMGICRLYLNQVRLATKHFQYLLQYPSSTYPDLFQDIAYAYYDKRHYELALPVFQKIIDGADEIEVDLLVRTADCYRETNDLDTAVLFYLNVLEEQPDNLDVMMSLATVYEEQGNEEKALELVDYVMKKNRESRQQKKSSTHKQATAAQERISQSQEAKRNNKSKKASLFDESSNGLTIKEYYSRRKDETNRREEEKTYATLGLFSKLDELDEKIGPNTVDAERPLIREYIRTAQELWQEFSNTSVFYPSERSTRYQGFYAFRKARNISRDTDNLNAEAHHMANRLRTRVKLEEKDQASQDQVDFDEEERHLREEEEKNASMIHASDFRGVSFDRWLYMILRYAYALAMSRRFQDSFNVLTKAINANVFYHDIPKKTTLYLAVIGCGIVGGNNELVQYGARWLCNFYQFRNDPYRIYQAVVDAGNKDATLYASQPQLKFLNRTIRLMDAVVSSKRKDQMKGDDRGASTEQIRLLDEEIQAMNMDPSTINEQDPKRYYHMPAYIPADTVKRMGIEAPDHVNPILLGLFADLVLLSKNPLAASLFNLRAYAVAPKDRLNTLSLGISFLHTAIQRKTDNRHLQIMQGMLFIFEYAKLADHNQESEFNIARAFHMLGLTHLAIPHYEKVLCMPPTSKSYEKQIRPLDSAYTWPISEQEEAELEKEQDDENDLKREAAYNLHLIYVTSGSFGLAQILLLKYCSI
ncbi:hypothetical protein EDC96DRAFT_564132 [Choanephora cucurbitarum]|nr:hypothetical protein EDC96DRAFT_564132 [Choanephora cucurbitarum]